METSSSKHVNEIIGRADREVGYFTAALRAGVDVTRKMLNSEEYKAVHGYDEIPVNMEYPQEGQQYPYVHVMYSNSRFYPSSLEEGRTHVDEQKEEVLDTRLYIGEGSYIIGVYANTILERETISDCLIGMLGCDDMYRDGFYSSEYFNVTPNMHTLTSPTANESIGTPWDADELTCYRQFKFDVRCEFLYRIGHPAFYIEAVDVDAEINPDTQSIKVQYGQ